MNGESEGNNWVDFELEESDPSRIGDELELNENGGEVGSQKALLLGNWQDADDPELSLRISPEKYVTYVNGKKNWDNPWDLSNHTEYAPENKNNNGKYVLVLLEDMSAVFYAQEIISLTEDQMDVRIVKSSAGSGMIQTFIRN